MNFVLEKGKERNYTYYFGECSKSIISAVAPKQFMKDEVQTSVLGLCGLAATGEVHDNPRGEMQSNPYTESRGGVGAFITAPSIFLNNELAEVLHTVLRVPLYLPILLCSKIAHSTHAKRPHWS